MGAAYQAAVLSKAFKVKKFAVKDASLFPVDVHFDRLVEGEDDAELTVKHQVKTIFSRNNAVPMKKVLSFKWFKTDFNFSIAYGDTTFLPEEAQAQLDGKEIAVVALKGVDKAYDDNAALPNVTSKGVKAHFYLDDSGLFHVTRAEVQFELPPEPEVRKEGRQ